MAACVKCDHNWEAVGNNGHERCSNCGRYRIVDYSREEIRYYSEDGRTVYSVEPFSPAEKS